MKLSKERIETLLSLLKDKSPETIFTILSEQLSLDTPYSPQMSRPDLKRLYRKISLLVHPDKLDETSQLVGNALFNLVKLTYNQLAFTDQHDSISHDVEDSILELHLLLLQRQSERFNLSDEVVIDLIESLIFPDLLPPECHETGEVALISQEIWQAAEQKLIDLVRKLEEKESQGALKGEAENAVFLNRKAFISLFRQSMQRWRQLTDSSANSTEQHFIQTYLLPELRRGVLPHRSPFFDFPHVRGSASYISSITLNIKVLLRLGFYERNFLHSSTHVFLRDKSLDERKQLYYSLIQQLEPRVKDDKYLDQCCAEIINTIKQYTNHYSGFMGSLRFYYRTLFDSEAFQMEQRAIVRLDAILNNIYLPLLREVVSFSTEVYTIPEMELPVLDANQSPFLYALVARLQQVDTAYRASKGLEREQVQTIYKAIANQEPAYQNISREMGTFGFFGAFGRTRTRERCLHTLKQSILGDLITEAGAAPDHTVTVPAETLDIIRQHNGRFWRYGRTDTQARFDEAFELVAPKDENHEASYRCRYSL